MEFENKTENRIKFPLRGGDWITVRPGERIEIEDEFRAKAHGLTDVVKATQSKISKKVVETKQVEPKKRKRRK